MSLHITERVILAVLLWAPIASAREEMIIKQVDQHPDYIAELEVHGLVAYGGGPLAIGRYDLYGFGPGFRGNIRLMKNGFIPNLNNNIAIGLGAELVFAPVGGSIGGVDVRLVTPVVLQWNFWMTTHWSLLAEPGIAFAFPMSTPRGAEPIYVTPTLAVGGRYNFNDHVALVIRLGYPISSVGVSFFL